ncbi:transposase domain-containing protein [Modicisalibacter xianhensis]
MSPIQSAKLNGHEPHAYLKDVLTRLQTKRPARSMNSHFSTGSRPTDHSEGWSIGRPLTIRL